MHGNLQVRTRASGPCNYLFNGHGRHHNGANGRSRIRISRPALPWWSDGNTDFALDSAVSQLRDFGVASVAQAARAVDARRQLEFRTFDFVLCEQHFPTDAMSGQDLLDDLRATSCCPSPPCSS